MTSCMVSPMSCRSPSVRVIRLTNSLDIFTFLCSPIHSLEHWRFSNVDVVSGSALPSSSSVSISFYYPCEGNFFPLRTFSSASYAALSYGKGMNFPFISSSFPLIISPLCSKDIHISKDYSKN